MSDQELARVAVVVMAHPDDAEFGCAGTVAAWAREGWEIHYVVCTDASGGGPDDATDVGAEARRHINETRKAEQRAACDILGVRDIRFLDMPDGTLQPTIELRRELVRIYRTYRPTRLLCQSPVRSWRPIYRIGAHHPDHLAAGEAAIAAMYPASQNPWDFPELLEEGLGPHKIRELYVIGSPEPNFGVDISDTFALKIEALRAHHSQLGDRMALVEERLRGWAAEIGKQFELPLAEAFHKAENP
jgi:LmbE family N-acetylglucosaminyl deacetylase